MSWSRFDYIHQTEQKQRKPAEKTQTIISTVVNTFSKDWVKTLHIHTWMTNEREQRAGVSFLAFLKTLRGKARNLLYHFSHTGTWVSELFYAWTLPPDSQSWQIWVQWLSLPNPSLDLTEGKLKYNTETWIYTWPKLVQTMNTQGHHTEHILCLNHQHANKTVYILKEHTIKPNTCTWMWILTKNATHIDIVYV